MKEATWTRQDVFLASNIRHALASGRRRRRGWRQSMKAEIIAVGTELLLGEILDTNSQYLAQQLTGLGIDLYFVTHVGDNLSRLTETVRRGLERSDLVVMTGGIGPTDDDLTREAVAAALG